MIVWEKRQASINLSRNLGHDLTNIIATIGDDFSDLGLPNFSFNDLEELAEWLTNHFVKNRVLAIT